MLALNFFFREKKKWLTFTDLWEGSVAMLPLWLHRLQLGSWVSWRKAIRKGIISLRKTKDFIDRRTCMSYGYDDCGGQVVAYRHLLSFGNSSRENLPHFGKRKSTWTKPERAGCSACFIRKNGRALTYTVRFWQDMRPILQRFRIESLPWTSPASNSSIWEAQSNPTNEYTVTKKKLRQAASNDVRFFRWYLGTNMGLFWYTRSQRTENEWLILPKLAS